MTTTVSRIYGGFVDFLTQHRVAGWSQSPHLSVWCKGHPIHVITPDVARPDLIDAGIEGAFGFDVTLPRGLWLDDDFKLVDSAGGVLRADESRSYLPRLRSMTRHLDLDAMRGLEIGPLDKPLIPKDRFRVSYADHASRADLVAKYASAGHGRDLEKICEVDFILSGVTLRAAAKGETFNYLIGSHVAEHIPDLIGWLWDIWSILEVDGVVVLALPHRDFTFDSKRRTTTFSDLIDGYLARLTSPSPRQILEHMIGVHQHFGNDLFAQDGRLLKDALQTVSDGVHAGVYTDCHCSVFTPESFSQCWNMLSICGLAGFSVIEVEEGTGSWTGEFYVHLRKRADVEPPALRS